MLIKGKPSVAKDAKKKKSLMKKAQKQDSRVGDPDALDEAD
jgi:hypothetical protein